VSWTRRRRARAASEVGDTVGTMKETRTELVVDAAQPTRTGLESETREKQRVRRQGGGVAASGQL